MKEKQRKCRVGGFLVDSRKHQGIAGLRVEAWDKNFVLDEHVGSAITNERGAFQIEFDAQHEWERFPDLRPDLYFKVFYGSECIKSTEDSVVWNIAQELTEISIEVDWDNKGLPLSLEIDTYEQLLAREGEILERIANTPNGGSLFLIHPFQLLEDLGVTLSDNAKAEILALEPRLGGLSTRPYQALKNSQSDQTIRVHMHGLFSKRSV